MVEKEIMDWPRTKRSSKPENDFQCSLFKKKKMRSGANANKEVNANWTEYDVIAYIQIVDGKYPSDDEPGESRLDFERQGRQ